MQKQNNNNTYQVRAEENTGFLPVLTVIDRKKEKIIRNPALITRKYKYK